MRRVRRLFGSVAAVVAVGPGQAAELPVKAGPVQYVQICGAYGAGFYYIPGMATEDRRLGARRGAAARRSRDGAACVRGRDHACQRKQLAVHRSHA